MQGMAPWHEAPCSQPRPKGSSDFSPHIWDISGRSRGQGPIRSLWVQFCPCPTHGLYSGVVPSWVCGLAAGGKQTGLRTEQVYELGLCFLFPAESTCIYSNFIQIRVPSGLHRNSKAKAPEKFVFPQELCTSAQSTPTLFSGLSLWDDSRRFLLAVAFDPCSESAVIQPFSF